MAINPEDKIYTWYLDGKVSVGSSNDLDRYLPPRSFSLPSGKRVTDIRDIGITKGSKVYVWYSDSKGNGTLSIGQSRNLGEIVVDDEGKARKVRFPAGKNMLNVVGISIAKSNDHVYAWYDDGTLSSGTSLDFTRYFSDRPYSLKGGSRYQIRAMGIAKNDHIYTWLSNGKAQSGMSNNLSKYIQPYDYSLPPQGRRGGTNDPERWYREITLQHLFKHRAGFQRNGDTAGTATMFNVSDEQMTYEQVHRHFLKTRPLKWHAGNAYSYSNHGFGLWTIIIEALSGKSYRSYAINNYLKPLDLKGSVRPSTVNNDKYDACAHELRNGKFKAIDFKNSTLGLAAGGWTASAASLLKITHHLENTYSTQELNNMGWGLTGTGALSHNGLTNGGTAFVVMFPAGYKSVKTGDDLSNVHVALAANIRTSTSALTNLANKIAREVPKSNIAPGYDAGSGKSILDHSVFNCE